MNMVMYTCDGKKSDDDSGPDCVMNAFDPCAHPYDSHTVPGFHNVVSELQDLNSCQEMCACQQNEVETLQTHLCWVPHLPRPFLESVLSAPSLFRCRHDRCAPEIFPAISQRTMNSLDYARSKKHVEVYTVIRYNDKKTMQKDTKI
jgi:hypothetical protein